ncbi:ovochymase-1 [Halyomorpha halys]|uniref:ovochymase-1 n=1 Tax=Halyomorpha halys TaxID=286706 RepID=UPI0006D51137|nr:Putative serine protease persephone-like [Halyomorpha halys]
MKEVLVCLVLLGTVAANKTLFLNLGDKCEDENEPWTCQYSSSCKALQQEKTKSSLHICCFEGLKTIVCCPPDTTGQNGTSSNSQSGDHKSETLNNGTESSSSPLPSTPSSTSSPPPSSTPSPPLPSTPSSYGKIAEQKCREYAKYVYIYIDPPILVRVKKKKIDECAISSETLIVGGKPAKPNEFPHMALIGIDNNNTDIEWFCGGSLISPRFILTAAHCNISQHIESVVVRLGDLDVKDDTEKSTPITLKVIEVFDHPKYNHSRAYHDISLLKLEKDVELGPSIRPLCLHTSSSIAQDKAIATGWGHTSFAGYESNHLLKVELDLLSDERCKSEYDFEHVTLSQGITPETIFCAGGKEDKDTCQGDSGGPLQITLKEPYCMYSQIGVTAFGVACGIGTPGGYTRVSHYIPWIESIVWSYQESDFGLKVTEIIGKNSHDFKKTKTKLKNTKLTTEESTRSTGATLSLPPHVAPGMSLSRLFFFFFYMSVIGGLFGQRNILNKNVDEVCKSGPDNWICKTRNNCHTLRKAFENGIRPDICTFIGNEAIFCCPSEKYISSIGQTTGSQPTVPAQTSSANETKSVDEVDSKKSSEPSISSAELKAEEKCKAYSKYAYQTVQLFSMVPGQKPKNITTSDCTMETLIVGGVEAKPKEFPHMALIGYEETKTRKINWICGGSLISTKFVLTAAHCVLANNRFQYWVRLGDLDTSSDRDDSKPVNFRVIKKIIHPQYNDKHVYHDIALFELESEATLDNYIRPLCLQSSKEKESERFLASGWGHTEWEGKPSAKLQKIILPLVPHQICNKSYDSSEDRNVIPNGIINDYMFCAGGAEQKDTCQGDSGGPLQIVHKNLFCMYSIVGVVSYGKGCALGYPGIYTRVSNYVPWIVKNVWP